MRRAAKTAPRTASATAARWAGHEKRVRFMLQLPPELLARVDAEAKRAGVSRARATELLLVFALSKTAGA